MSNKTDKPQGMKGRKVSAWVNVSPPTENPHSRGANVQKRNVEIIGKSPSGDAYIVRDLETNQAGVILPNRIIAFILFAGVWVLASLFL